MKEIKADNLPEIAFIIGMGRSGTTLLTNMFNSNPAVVSTPENEFILFAYESFRTKNFGEKNTADTFTDLFNHNYNNVLSIWKPAPELRNDIDQLKEKSFANACKLVYLNYPFAGKEKENIRYIVDKNPVYSLYLEKLKTVYPKAKYIVLTRDFRDNVLSRKKNADAKISIFELAASWNYYYDCIFRDLKKYSLDHLLVRYEDLVAAPEQTLKTICNYLGIEYSEQMLGFQDLSKKIKAHVKESATADVYNKINRMHSNLDNDVNLKRVNAYENELSGEEIGILNYVCRYFGEKFNYLPKEKSSGIKLSWRIKQLRYRVVVSLYYSMKALYYKLPVGFRLRRLRK